MMTYFNLRGDIILYGDAHFLGDLRGEASFWGVFANLGSGDIPERSSCFSFLGEGVEKELLLSFMWQGDARTGLCWVLASWEETISLVGLLLPFWDSLANDRIGVSRREPCLGEEKLVVSRVMCFKSEAAGLSAFWTSDTVSSILAAGVVFGEEGGVRSTTESSMTPWLLFCLNRSRNAGKENPPSSTKASRAAKLAWLLAYSVCFLLFRCYSKQRIKHVREKNHTISWRRNKKDALLKLC